MVVRTGLSVKQRVVYWTVVLGFVALVLFVPFGSIQALHAQTRGDPTKFSYNPATDSFDLPVPAGPPARTNDKVPPPRYDRYGWPIPPRTR